MEDKSDLDHVTRMSTSIWPSSLRKREGMLYGLLLLVTLALILSACGGTQAQQQTPSQTPLPLPPIGGLPPAAAGLQPTGQLSPNMKLQLTIGLLTNRQALENDLAALYDPNSPQYGQYLTPQQVADRYGASQANIDKVISFLQTQGFQILSVSSLRDSVRVSASVAQIAQTFQITLLTFQQNNQTFFAPGGTVTLPAALKGLVTSVVGLSNFAKPRPQHTLPATAQAQSAPTQKPGVDCSGAHEGVTMSQIAAAYNYSSVYKAGYKGKGINIGVMEFDDANISLNDLTTFVTCATGGTLHYSVVKVDGGASTPDALDEAEMDIEYLAALAPDAQIIEYQGANSYVDVMNQVASDGRVQVFSASYGNYEAAFSRDEIDAIDQDIKRMAAEGITFAESSGDCAAYDDYQYGDLSVEFPAGDPYAIGAGGTLLQTDGQGRRQKEPAWDTYSQATDRSTCQYNDWGTGGGVGTIFKLPSWQTGPGVKNKYSNGHRELPDVAAISWNINLYYKGQWSNYGGGTSAAAPIWIAGIALVDQGLRQHHKHLVGGAPTFYQVANKHGKYHPYYDVTQGDNIHYPATAGYDLTTGWGAPNLLDFGKVLGGF